MQQLTIWRVVAVLQGLIIMHFLRSDFQMPQSSTQEKTEDKLPHTSTLVLPRHDFEKISKDSLLQYLQGRLFVRVGISTLPNGGVGVIAIKDIPKGVDPFALASGKPCSNAEDTAHCYQKSELETLEASTKKVLTDFVGGTTWEKAEEFCIPAMGPNSFGVGWFLNHHTTNYNMEVYDCECYFNCVRTKRAIREGEELLMTYKQLGGAVETFD
eukprot:m.500544 g.500544  ORF g.500544 m.500544 type:complete len:213 (+) comp21834_c0_seq12:300-938(+)